MNVAVAPQQRPGFLRAPPGDRMLLPRNGGLEIVNVIHGRRDIEALLRQSGT